MKIKTIVQTDKHPNVPWPEEVPLPSAGDSIMLTHDGQTLEILVDQRTFNVGTDSQESARMVQIIIHGHHPTPGSV
ncbi:MAG: hypothetical protein WDO56_15495 [Gammaproteobacteria bacterium]